MARVCSMFALIVLLAVALTGCGGNPTGQLVSITITPDSAGMDMAGSGGGGHQQYIAYGNYQNPSETRDITAEVKWTTDAPTVGFFDGSKPGLLTSSGACGLTNVKVTASGSTLGVTSSDRSVMLGFATFKAVDSTAPSSNKLCAP